MAHGEAKKTGRKILVAVDGSVYSSNAVNYLAALFSGVDTIQFHFYSVVPASSLPDAGREWMDELSLLSALTPEARNRYSRTKRYLDEAVAKMVRLGFSPDQVSCGLQLSHVGVAADILAEARKGIYDALVLGRRGVSKIEEMFMGSVSATILNQCHDIPIWLVDKQVQSPKILVPVDGSVHSLLAVDHLGYIMAGNPHVEITLFHSSAMFSTTYTAAGPEEYYVHWDRAWCDQYLAGEDSLYEAPRQLLIEAGVPAERIEWLHALKGIEASRQIIRQALVDDFGTIVMGRHGVETKKGLFSRVSDRVVFMADQVAIWIVG